MDPTEILTRVRNRFNTENISAPIPPAYTLSDEDRKYTADVTLASINEPPETEFVDKNLYNKLQKIKDSFSGKNISVARSLANPFEKLGKGIFFDRAGLKLANIDAVLNISGHKGGFLAKQHAGAFVFADLAGSPGAFTQYLQYRNPESIMYGISLKGDINWNLKILDSSRTNITYGGDNTGNLYTQANWFAGYVRQTQPSGVDLVVSDGGISVENKEELQEFLNTRLILSEMLTALRVLKVGGVFVCKLYDTVTKTSTDLLYLMALCFDYITLFKPVSSRPANSEKYLVCKGLRDNIEDEVLILNTAYDNYSDENYIYKLIEKLPQNFTTWLINQNNLFTTLQLEAVQRISDLLEGKEITIPEYNLLKVYTVFNLPGEPVRENK